MGGGGALLVQFGDPSSSLVLVGEWPVFTCPRHLADVDRLLG
jgi:hypothetical protein